MGECCADIDWGGLRCGQKVRNPAATSYRGVARLWLGSVHMRLRGPPHLLRFAGARVAAGRDANAGEVHAQATTTRYDAVEAATGDWEGDSAREGLGSAWFPRPC